MWSGEEEGARGEGWEGFELYRDEDQRGVEGVLGQFAIGVDEQGIFFCMDVMRQDWEPWQRNRLNLIANSHKYSHTV